MMRVVLLMLAPLLAAADVTVSIDDHWSGGFQGKACFTVQQDLNTWKVHLTFDKPVNTLDTRSAIVVSVSDDKTEYVLSNLPNNDQLHNGDSLCVDFIGHGNGDIKPETHAALEGATGGGTLQVTTRDTQAPRSTERLQARAASNCGSGDAQATVQVKNDYPSNGGFEEWFDFNVDKEFNGWIMKICFAKPVTDFHVSQASIYNKSADGTEYVLSNTDDYLLLKAGDHMQQRITGKVAPNSGGAPGATAVLVNMGVNDFFVDPLPNKAGSKYNYDDVLYKSILFYEAQRSGKLPRNNRIPWRGDSALGDKGDNGEDLTGGWYDAGDYVKFNFPQAWATVVLEWGLLLFKDAYQAAGQLDWMYDSIKWPLDYLLKCHVADNVLYVQVGNGGIDHGSWGRPEEMTMARPAYKIDASHPGSDVAMETAAAFAAGYLVFKEKDPSYAATLLKHAKTLWTFAINHQGLYSQSVSAASGFYTSANTTDELCWGSLWLYKATGDKTYLDTALKYFDPSPDWGMSWDDNLIGNQILLYQITGEDIYKSAVEETFKGWFPRGDISYTPKGLAWRLQWGSLRYSSNMAFAALAAAEAGIHPEEYRHWALCQIHYALGDAGRSFVVGFGTNPPKQPHHRSSSCPNVPAKCDMNVMHLPPDNVHILYGAMVGGPDANDGYTDKRDNYVNNEVAVDYNAGFQSAVAGLRHLLLIHKHPGDNVCPYRA